LKKILLFSILFFSAQHSKASHAAAAEILYHSAGANQYIVTVNLYSDCSATGQQIYPTTNITFSSASCGQNGSQAIPLLTSIGIAIEPGNYPSCGTSTCAGGSAYGVRKYSYEGLINLPSVCSDWKISAELTNRNTVITNIINAQNYSIYLEAVINNLSAPVNHSPDFSSVPVALHCISLPYHFDQNAADNDNDSLVFSFISARGSTGTGNPVVPLTYINSLSASNPLFACTPLILDVSTGSLDLTTTQQQATVIVYRIDEYRNGTFIGSVMRDMQLIIQASCNIIPSLNKSVSSTVLCTDSTFLISLNAPVQCTTIATDGSDFRLYDPVGQPLPLMNAVAQNCNSGYATEFLLKLNQPFSASGTYTLFSKTGSDLNTLINRCGNTMAEFDTLLFTVGNCFTGNINILNVSVSENEDAAIITWNIPEGLPSNEFRQYNIYRSDLTIGPYLLIDSVNVLTDTVYIDYTAAVTLHPVSYALSVEAMLSPAGAMSDSIQSIFLSCDMSVDSEFINLDWTQYNGWENAFYEILLSENGGGFEPAVSTGINTSKDIDVPDKNGNYRARVRSSNNGLVTLSNSCDFTIDTREIVIPNIITPGDDGKNDVFKIQNLEQYPGTLLSILNRWGKEVYHSANYNNDWNATDVTEGTYYYVLKLSGKAKSEYRGTLTILRR
jgi:gliding motility-associated-like protein